MDCFDGGFSLRNKERPLVEARATSLSVFICYMSPSLNEVVTYLLNNAPVNVDNCLSPNPVPLNPGKSPILGQEDYRN